MLDFLKNAANKFAQGTKEYMQNRAFITQLLQMNDPNELLQTLRAKIHTLDERGYQSFQGAIILMLQEAQLAANTIQSSSDSAGSAWGNSYEDEMAYTLAHFSEGPRGPSPMQMQQMQQVQVYAQSLQALANYAAQFWAEPHSIPIQPPPATPSPSEAMSAAKAASQPTSAELKKQLAERMAQGADEASLFPLLREIYQAEIREGAISPERRAMLDGKMDQIKNLFDDKSDETTDLISRADKARRIATDLIPAVANPSLPKTDALPPPAVAELKQRMADMMLQGADDQSMAQVIQEMLAAETREGMLTPERKQQLEAALARYAPGADAALAGLAAAGSSVPPVTVSVHPTPRSARTSEILAMLKTQLMQEKTQVPLAAQEDKVWEAMFGSTINIQNAIGRVRSDFDAYKLEREALRPLALQMQDFFLRKHLLLTKPYFPTRAVTPDPNVVFFSGDADLRQLVAQICQTQRLSLQAEAVSVNPAQQRWDQLRMAAVAIFDMRRYSRAATYAKDPQTARQVAAAAYELGIAFAIGKPVVVVVKPEQALPFDVDIEPVRLSGAANDLDLLAVAIESAFYGRQRGGEEGSIAVTIESMRRLYGNSTNTYVRNTVATLDANAAGDAVKTRQITGQLLRFLGTEAPWMIFPAWPGDYPRAQGRFCFHVTAFEGSDRPWPKWTKEIVQSECLQGITYKRGDQSEERDIIRAIWHDICRAWYVVADISDLNPNAVMELGMAHVLGRKVLLITKDSNMSSYPDTIAKERKVVYTFTDTNDSPELRAALRKFFAS